MNLNELGVGALGQRLSVTMDEHYIVLTNGRVRVRDINGKGNGIHIHIYTHLWVMGERSIFYSPCFLLKKL
jgi:hypothetical protein